MLFPPELWVRIFKRLNCQDILNIKLVCHYFNKICVDYDLYIKRKFRSFPRPEGKCNKYFVNNLEDLDVSDVIRGDYIYLSTQKICIFDGHNILELHEPYINQFLKLAQGYLPCKFKILSDKVPIDYWTIGFGNNLLWFDQTAVQQQSINNIYFHEGDGLCYTSFIYDNETYTIKYLDDVDEESMNKEPNQLISDMKNILFSYTLLILYHNIFHENNLLLDRANYLVDQKLGIPLYQHLITL